MIRVTLDLLGLFLLFGFGCLVFGVIPVAVDEWLERRKKRGKGIR